MNNSRYELPEALLARLQAVRMVGVITGAGVSAESGIPTYRGKGGIYDDPEEGDRTVEALSGHTLQMDPDRTWKVLADLGRRAQAAKPNEAHHALVRMEFALEHFVLLTQNVDGLHQQAGSRNVIDIHGSASRVCCQLCDYAGTLEGEQLQSLQAAPRCPYCEGILRPDAVLFGEMLPPEKVLRMRAEFLDQSPDFVLTTGTTASFPYIVQPVIEAKRRGCLTVEVDPGTTDLSDFVDFSLRGPASRFVPLLADALCKNESA